MLFPKSRFLDMKKGNLSRIQIQLYSKHSIIRPGCFRLLEFEKKDSTGCLIETFSKYPDQVV
jgi:hypothetical protein